MNYAHLSELEAAGSFEFCKEFAERLRGAERVRRERRFAPRVAWMSIRAHSETRFDAPKRVLMLASKHVQMLASNHVQMLASKRVSMLRNAFGCSLRNAFRCPLRNAFPCFEMRLDAPEHVPMLRNAIRCSDASKRVSILRNTLPGARVPVARSIFNVT